MKNVEIVDKRGRVWHKHLKNGGKLSRVEVVDLSDEYSSQVVVFCVDCKNRLAVYTNEYCPYRITNGVGRF